MSIRFIIGSFLWVVVLVAGILVAARGRVLFKESVRDGVGDFIRTLPRIFLGVVGSGYLAEVVPQDVVTGSLGPDSGLLGIALATLAGALTPGGVVVGFSIAATALKSGAGAPQVIAYATAWSLFSINRMINWELSYIPGRVVLIRLAATLPVPFIAAIAAMLLGKP